MLFSACLLLLASSSTPQCSFSTEAYAFGGMASLHRHACWDALVEDSSIPTTWFLVSFTLGRYVGRRASIRPSRRRASRRERENAIAFTLLSVGGASGSRLWILLTLRRSVARDQERSAGSTATEYSWVRISRTVIDLCVTDSALTNQRWLG